MEWFANPPPETRASYIKTGEFIMGHLEEVSVPGRRRTARRR